MSTATAASEIALPPHPRDELKGLALEADQFYASDDWKNADAPTRQKYLDRSAEVFDEAFKSAESSLDAAEADSFYNSTTAFLQGKMAEHNNRDADEKRRRAAADKSMQVFTERQKVTPDQVRGVVIQSLEVAGGMSAQIRGSGVMKLVGEQGNPSIGVQPLDWTPSTDEFWKNHYDLTASEAEKKSAKDFARSKGKDWIADDLLYRSAVAGEESAKLAARDLAFSKGEDAAGVAAAEREATLAHRRNAKLAALESTQSSAGNPKGRKLPFRVVRTNGMLNIEPEEGKAEEAMMAAERMGLLTSEEAARLIPSGVEMDKEFASRPKAQGSIVTAVKEFGSSILPALGTAAGTAIGAAASKGDISTAMVGGASGGSAALWMQKKVFGEVDQAQREANARAHPGWAQVGSFVPFLVSMFQKTPPAITTAGRMAQTAKVALTPGTAAARWESALQSGIAMGRAGFSSGVQQRYVEGNKDVNPIDEGVRSFIAGGAMGILKPAKSILMAMTGKAVKDAAAVTFAEGLYDLAVHNKPIDFKAIADEAPGTFTAFALQNAVMGLFHKFAAAPEARRARAFENYRMARERQDAKLRSGEWGFDAYNEAVTKLDEVFTAKIKSEKDKEAFLEHAAIYAARHKAAQAATQAAEVHAKAANDAEQQAQRFSDQGYPESAAEARKLAQTHRAAMEKAYADAYAANYLAAQSVADAKIAVEQAAPAPHPIIAQIDSVVAAHASELSALGHPAELVLVTIPDESGGGGLQFNQKSGKIEYDPARIEKLTIGMTPRQRAKYIQRGIAEEIIHVATDKYASESPENEAKLRAILGDAEAVAAAKKAYGENAFEKLNETQKAFEVARVLIQGPRALTEAAYRFFKDFLRWLSQKVKNLSPETKELLDGIKAKMEAHKSGKVEEAETARVSDDEMSKRRTPLPQKDRRSLQDRAEEAVARLAGPERAHAERRLESIARDHNQIRREYVDAKTVGEKLRLEMEMVEVENRWRKISGETEIEINHAVTADDIKKDAERLYYREQEIEAKLKNGEAITPQDRQDWKIAGRKSEELPKAIQEGAPVDANYKPEPAKESEPKNEKAQSVPSVQKADEPVRLPQKEVAPVVPPSSEPTAVLPVGSFVKADRYKSEGTPLKIIGTEPSRDGRPVYQALVNGRVMTLDSKEISEVVSTPEQAAAASPEPPAAPSPEPVTPAAAKPNTLTGYHSSPNQITGPLRISKGRANAKSGEGIYLSEAEETSKAWVGRKPGRGQIHTKKYSVRLDNPYLHDASEGSLIDELGMNPDEVTAHLKKLGYDGVIETYPESQGGGRDFVAFDYSQLTEDAMPAAETPVAPIKSAETPAQPAAAPAAEQPAPAPIEQAIADANWRGTVREVPAPRSMGGEGVKLYIPVDASGKDVSVGGQTILGKTPAEAIELAQKNAKPAPAPIAAPTKGRAEADSAWLEALMGSGSEAVATPQAVQSFKPLKPIIDTLRSDLEKQAEDWDSRKYKPNKTQVELRGDGPGKRDSISIGSINEGRRQKALDAIGGQIRAIDKLSDAISTPEGEAALDSAIKRTWDEAGKTFQNSRFKNQGDLFESLLIEDVLKLKPARGAYDSLPLSKAIRARMEAESTPSSPAPVAAPTKGRAETPTVSKRENAPQVAQPTKLGGKADVEIPQRVGSTTESGQLYVFPGFEDIKTVVVKPSGSKAKSNKRGWRVYEQSTGMMIAESLDSLNRPTSEQDAIALALQTMRANGYERFSEKLQKFATAVAEQRKPSTPSSPAPSAIPQSEGGIFGYAWADIRSKQQGGKQAALIRGAAVKPKATEADLKLLESKGAEWLYDNEKFGIIDRLGLPVDKPSKKAEAKAPVSEKAKQTKGVTLKVQNPYSLAPENEKILTMKGDIIKLAAQPEHEFFIYKAPNSNYWRVVERKTGSGIGAEMQKTRAAAIESAEQSVAKVAPDEFTKILNDAEWRNTEKPSKKAEAEPLSPVSEAAKPETPAPKTFKRKARELPPAPGGGEDVIDYIINNIGKLRSRGTAFDIQMKQRGQITRDADGTNFFKLVSKRIGGEYDGLNLPPRLHAAIIAKRGLGVSLDEAAQMLFDAHMIRDAKADTMHSAIHGAYEARLMNENEGRVMQEMENDAQQQSKDFAEDSAKKKKGTTRINVLDLSIGDVVEVNGEKLTVIATDGFDVTLEDGEKYGIQDVDVDAVIYGKLTEGGDAAPEKVVKPVTKETPEPVAPKLRPSDGKGTGELLQGDAAPFNLVAETAADIAKREAREAAEQIAKDAKDAAEAKAKQDKEQGNLFGVATPRMGQELADKADALGIPLKTEQIKKLIADDPDTLREVRARIDRETGGDQAGMVRTANPLENRDERSAPFYSALTKTVQALPQETMTVQQARAAIEKGAKKDEIAMSGILTDPLSPLAGKQPGDKVTKAELTGYALERQATVQDVVLGQPLGDKVKRSAQDAVPFSRQGFDGWIIPDANGDMTFAGSTKQDAADRWNDAWRPTDTPASTHFSQYQLPGADEGSYREMFVTWPNRAQQNVKDWTASRVTTKDYGPMIQGGGRAVWEIRNKDGEYIGSLPQADYVSGDEAIAAVASKGNLSLSESRKNWNDGHPQYSDIANPIVRIRRNIRTDADGKRTYFIEEMQGPGKGEQEKMPPELRKRIYEIGMKRALRDAVDEGADAIAWTTGEQQAERYDLSKQVDEVSVSRGGALGKWEVWATKDGRQVVNKTVETLQEVDGLIGKELAEKVSDMKAGDFQRRFSGLDLKVGGEGLKRVYDQMLPAIANDLAKKFGVKAGTAEIGTGKAFKDVDARAEEIWQEWENAGTTYGKDFADAQEQAQQEAGDRPSKTGLDTVHSLPIPDALKTQQRGGNTIFTANPADSLRETSTKNAVVDEERAKLGLDPIMSEIRQSHPVVWDAAMRALERDPMAGQSLVNEINGRPRALTATEEAIILRHKINTQTAFYREMEVANDGNASPQDRMSAKLYAAQHLDAMNEIDNATRKSGTEWGRLGAFRQRLAREDYTLVAMLRKRSMATGERIEPGGAEYQFVEKLNKRIAELEAKATQDARNHAAELEQLRETAMEDAIQKMRSDGTPAQKKEREILARIAANMESAKENADAALREMGFGPVANDAGPSGNIIGTANPQDANTLDPKVLKLLSVGGANHLRKLGNDRAKWDEAMLSNYGPKVQPHLDAVWDVSQATLNDFIDGQAPKETRENTKKKILTDAEKQKRILDSIRRKSATPDKVAPYLKQLAKQLVSQGVSDRWTLLTTMETMLKDILPDATRSEIRDSLADYGEGKYRELSTDEVSVKMRRLRAQLQQEAKIEDMMRRGELPWLIGSERGEPDAETRTMIKEVNEIKKELELEATNENQGKSARAAIKTRLRNEIEELEKFIKTRERIPSNRRSVEDDPETAQLRRDVRELRAKYQEIVGVDTMAEEAAKESALEKSIADLQNQIVTGEIEQAAKQQTVDTPEIAALKAQKAALLEQRKALRSPSTEDIERKKEQALLDRITKLSARIATGVADTKAGKPTVESANVSAYRDIIKDLNKQLAEIRNPKKSPEQTKLDELDKRIAEVSAKIARGDLSAKQGKPTVDTAEQAVRKDTLRALNKQLADMRKAAKPTLTPDEIALKTWKTRAEKRLIDLKDRTARGDFSKKVRKVMPMDTEALKTKAALEAAKLEFDQANHKAMTANAPWWVKTMDVAQKYRRWAVLTSVTVFEKLAAAAAWRTFVFQPTEDAAGSVIRHIPFIKQVAEMAPRHGQGFNTRIQLDGLINGFASGASEAATHLKKAGNLLTGSKALSWLFGEMDEAKRLTQTPMEMLSGKRKVEPDTAWEIPGVLHAVVKDIPKMVEFHKSVAFRTKWYADRGVDVSDPLMQEKIQIESFQDAMRAIFMQDNAVLNKLNRFIRSLGEPDAKTGKVNKWGKVWQTAFKVEFPIVKIPTNIVAEAFEYVSGFPAGLLNVRRAIKDGITNLQPEHADMIMRQLKKGLVGPAIFLTGFLLAANIGGYFQHGKKRDPDEVPAGGVRIGNTTIHERLMHSPALLIFQAGATTARVMDSRMRKSDVDEQGMGAGLVAAAMGLADEIPFVKEAFNLSELRNPYQKSHWFGAKARSIVEPTLMQWIAKLRDTDEEGNPIKRQADGFVDEMKMGIPGLRETLDVKQENVPHARSHRR